MTLGRTAVVLGGSVAGMCTAGALTDHFDQVVVLERDVLPEDAEHRRGVPQSKHPHFLLNSGRRAIGELFDGFEADLIGGGGMLLNPSLDAAYLEEKGWAARKESSMTMVYSSRILIERVLRDRVRTLANVTVREGVSVDGLQFTDGAVTGVSFTQDGTSETIDADLVVDTMGRGSSVMAWLAQAGYPEPPIKTLDAKVTYVSRWYDLPVDSDRPHDWWWKHIVIMPSVENDPNRPDEHYYLSNFFPIDGNRAIACMGSWGLKMPRTPDELTASAGRLRTPLFLEAMDGSTPTSEVHLTRSTGNVWRRFDKVAKAPAGLVFIGDSICAFNPFYAQGMSSASSSAVLLKKSLDQLSALDAGFAQRFTKDQVALLKVPWGMAMARDRGYEVGEGTETVPRWQQKVMAFAGGKAFQLIVGAAREDEVIDEHFSKVFNLDESMGEMFKSPRVLFGLARYQVKSLFGRTKVQFGFDPLQAPPATDYSKSKQVTA